MSDVMYILLNFIYFFNFSTFVATVYVIDQVEADYS